VTVQVHTAAAPTFVAASVPTTLKVCVPRLRFRTRTPETHGAAGAPSSEQVNVTGEASMAENWNCAFVSVVGSLGPESMVVTGAVRSTIQVKGTIDATLPAWSTPAAWNVCGPSVSLRRTTDPLRHPLFR